ncbi:SnoaL-like domain [Prauserella sp. Am3]|nr:SnoaL-like domain [Prauserella sp. Am3]
MVQVGRNRLAGTFHGRDQLFGHFADIGRETSAMEMEPVELLGSDGRVAALNRMTVEIGGHSREFRVIHVFRIVDGRIVELYSVPPPTPMNWTRSSGDARPFTYNTPPVPRR